MPMSTDDVGKYKKLYLDTAREYVKQMEELLSVLLTTADSQEKSKEMLMAAHSLTSQSLLMGYNLIAEYTSLLENIFRAQCDGQFSLNTAMINVIVDGVKKLSVSLDKLEADGTELDMSAEVKQLEALSRIKGGRKTENVEN